MENIWLLGIIIFGFFVLIKSADYLVSGASSIAVRLGIPEMIIGLTIVAFGTSAPELVVNIISTTQGKGDIVVGNILGSGMVNIGLGLGLAALITPLAVKGSVRKIDIPIGILGLILFFALSWTSGEHLYLSRIGGVVLLVGFGLFLFQLFKRNHDEHDEAGEPTSTWVAVALFVGGCIGLIIGGKLVVDNAVDLARNFGVAESIIGLTIVAAGGSLPEVATCVSAARDRSPDLAIGNVAGSQVFNILLVMGISGAIAPVTFSPSLMIDGAMLLAFSLLLILLSALNKDNHIHRFGGGLLVVIYIGYLVYLGLQA